MNPKYGYNCLSGGSNGTPSEETRKKMRENHPNVSGKNNPLYGKKHTEESIKKMSESHKGLTKGSSNYWAKKIAQYDICGNLIRIWDCINDAGRCLGVDSANISACCRGLRKQSHGYIWRYFDDKPTKEYIEWCNKNANYRSRKRIVQYSLSKNIICVFDSLTEAELKTGIHHSSISEVCRGNRKTAGGYIWGYYKDEEITA